MLTENEQKVIRTLILKPRISLRGIIHEHNSEGSKRSTSSVASIAYIINSLEKKGFIKKIGVATTKYYQLTEKAHELKLGEVINFPSYSIQTVRNITQPNEHIPVVLGSTGDSGNTEHRAYLPKNFENGSGQSNTNPNSGTFLSASIAKIVDDPVNWGKYSNLIVWTILLSTIVLPLSYQVLKDQWFMGFILVASLLIIINKK